MTNTQALIGGNRSGEGEREAPNTSSNQYDSSVDKPEDIHQTDIELVNNKVGHIRRNNLYRSLDVDDGPAMDETSSRRVRYIRSYREQWLELECEARSDPGESVDRLDLHSRWRSVDRASSLGRHEKMLDSMLDENPTCHLTSARNASDGLAWHAKICSMRSTRSLPRVLVEWWANRDLDWPWCPPARRRREGIAKSSVECSHSLGRECPMLLCYRNRHADERIRWHRSIRCQSLHRDRLEESSRDTSRTCQRLVHGDTSPIDWQRREHSLSDQTYWSR